jgi:hypothetical protein
MHTSDEHIAEISKNVAKILECVCKDPDKSYDVKTLQLELFKVVQNFQAEIYDDKTPNENYREEAAKKFAEAYDAVETEAEPENVVKKSGISIESLQESAVNSGNAKVEIWDNARKEWEPKGWNIIDDSFEYKEITKGVAKVKYGFYDGHYYVQAEYGAEVYFSKFLKEKEECGRRSYGLWWWHLDKFYDLKENDATKYFPTSKELQECLADWFSYLVDACERQTKASLFEKILKEKYPENGNSIYTWHWGTVCEIKDGTDNYPYIFAYKDGDYKNSNNTTRIMLAVNDNDEKKLNALLQQQASASKSENVDGYNMALLETLPANTTDDEVVQKIKKWTDEINKIK